MGGWVGGWVGGCVRARVCAFVRATKSLADN